MIEELCEFLIRHGWDKDIADEAHDVYYHGDIEGVMQMAEGGELLDMVKRWKREVGEDR